MLKRFLFSLTLSCGVIQFSFAQEQGKETTATLQPKTTGFYNRTDLSFSKGFHHNDSWLLGIRNVTGYQFNPYVDFGVGIGLEKYGSAYHSEKISENTNLFLPVYSDLRIYFSDGKFKPFFAQETGYNFCVYQPNYNANSGNNNQIGGVFVNPGVGFKTKFSGKTALSVSVGYRYQEFTTKNLVIGNYYLMFSKFSGLSHYLTFKTGLTF